MRKGPDLGGRGACACARAERDLVRAQRVDLPPGREEQQVVVVLDGQHLLQVVVVAQAGPGDAHAAPVLHGQRQG